MSLLDDVSIVVTPNGYKAGELYAVVPVPTEGSEEVTNGDFATDSDWTKQAGWTISGGLALRSGESINSALQQSINIVSGKTYLVSYERTYISGGGQTNLFSEFITDGVNTTLGIYNDTIQETVTVTGTFTPTYSGTMLLRVYGIGTFNGTIDNVSVKEVIIASADMDVTRATAATRVDEAGLVNYAEIIGSEEVTDGDFSKEGADKVTNGDFSADSNWNQVGSNGWSIDTGTSTLNFTNASSYVFQGISTVSGKSYKVTLDIELNSGTIVAKSFSAQDVLTVTSTGRQTVTGYFTEIDSNANFGLVATGSASGKIHSVSVKEVGADWTKSGGATISDGKANINGDGTSFAAITQANVFTVGKIYKVTADVIITSGLGLKFQDGANNENIGFATTTGFYTFYFTATSNTSFVIGRRTGGTAFNSSIDNVSVKEVTRDNVPRIDYSGGGCPHILAEPQRTNLVTYSEDYTVYSLTRTTITSSYGTSPNGGQNSTAVFNTTETGGHNLNGNYFSVTSGVSYVNSVFAKAGTITKMKLRMFSGGGTLIGFNDGVFDLTNGTATGVGASIESYGNGWYRCYMIDSPTSSVSNARFNIGLLNANGDVNYTGLITDYIEVFGSEVSEGSYATSYIPTSGSTVTRNQDQFSRDGIGSLINSTEGTLVIEPRYFINDGSSTGRKIAISDGTSTNRIYITPYQGLASRIRYIFTNGGATQADLQVTGIDITISRKLAFVWKANRFELWQNGSKISEDTSGTTPSAGTFNEINLSSELGNGAEPYEGELKQLQVYKTALTDTQLAALTS